MAQRFLREQRNWSAANIPPYDESPAPAYGLSLLLYSRRCSFTHAIHLTITFYRIEAHQMARTDSATTAFSLESIESLALDLVTERQLPHNKVDSSGKPVSELSTHVSHAKLQMLTTDRVPQALTRELGTFRSCPLLAHTLRSATLLPREPRRHLTPSTTRSGRR